MAKYECPFCDHKFDDSTAGATRSVSKGDSPDRFAHLTSVQRKNVPNVSKACCPNCNRGFEFNEDAGEVYNG